MRGIGVGLGRRLDFVSGGTNGRQWCNLDDRLPSADAHIQYLGWVDVPGTKREVSGLGRARVIFNDMVGSRYDLSTAEVVGLSASLVDVHISFPSHIHST